MLQVYWASTISFNVHPWPLVRAQVDVAVGADEVIDTVIDEVVVEEAVPSHIIQVTQPRSDQVTVDAEACTKPELARLSGEKRQGVLPP